MQTVTERFLAAIRRSGLRYADLAKRTGLSRGQISDIVNGKRSPTLETVDRIAQVIGWPDQSGKCSICDINTKSSIIMESYWQWPSPPMELLDQDLDQFAERFDAARRGSPMYTPGAILRWKQVGKPIPRGFAREILERIASMRGGD
jgi:transcriptional regulator with XRE-family HTH domain